MTIEELKNNIKEQIKENGNQEITGQILQNVLVNMIDAASQKFEQPIFVVVSELPTEDIKLNVVYLVVTSNSEDSTNVFTEYVYVNGQWEKLGEFKPEVDLSGYVKSNDIYQCIKKDYDSSKRGANSIAIDDSAKASGNFATAVGNNAQATENGATALGYGTKATNGAVASGVSSQATGMSATALGGGSQATNEFTTALGCNAQATGRRSIALGNGARAIGEDATALGNDTKATGYAAIALGSYAETTNNYCIALGHLAEATGSNTTALGYKVKATGDNSTALGHSAQATGSGAVAVGNSAQATGSNTTALGYKVKATNGATALGHSAQATGSGAVAVGGQADGILSVALGAAEAKGDYSIALGIGASTNTVSKYALGGIDVNKEELFNLEEITSSEYGNKKYLIGLGGYDGTNLTIKNNNVETLNPNIKSVQDIINEKADLVDGKVPLSQLGNVDTQIVLVVDALPTENIKSNKIYLVKNTASEDTENIYTEYVYINNKWEELGEYKPVVDLSEYVKKNEFNNTVSGINTSIATKANAQDVTNAIGELQDKIDDIPTADEEDITTEGDTPQTQVLKLKDRAYDSLNASGKGYKILRKNWQTINGERKNVLTQEMINEPNTIYEIRYDFDLNGATIIIQNNCLLRFSGGTLNNGTIVGENTAIAANKDSIFNGITLNGTFNIEKLYAEWFGVIPDVETDNSSNINKAIDNAININRELFFIKNTYYISNPIILKSKLVINGSTGVETTTKIIYTGTKNCCEVYNDKHITIRNISFVKDGYNTLTIDEIDSNIIGIYFHNGIYRLKLDNCSFYGFGYAITGEGSKGSGMSYNNILNCQFRKCIIAIYFEGFSDPNVASLVSYCTYTNIENCIFSGMKRGAIYISVQSGLDIVNISKCNIEFIGYRNYFSSGEQTLFGIYLKSVLKLTSNVSINDCYMENIYHYDTINISENADYSNNYNIGVENIAVSIKNVNCINCINFIKSFGDDFIDIYSTFFNGNLIGERNIICIPNANTCLFVNTFTSTTDNFDIINCNIINEQGKLSLKSIMLNSIQAPHYAACFINIGNQTKTYDSLHLYINSENENCETNSGLLYHRPMNLKNFQISINSLTLYITGVFNINGQKISRVGYLVLDSGIISIGNRLGLYSVDSVKVSNSTIRSVGNNAFIKLFKANQNKVTDISFIKNSFEGDNDIILFEGEGSGIMTSAYANIFIERANKTSGIKVFAYNNENKVPVSIYGNNILEDNTILYTGIASFGRPMVSFEGQNYIDKNKLLPSWKINNKSIAADGYDINYNRKGTTTQRPKLSSADDGFEYYDSTLKKKVLWNGTAWVNMDGSSLG